MKQKAVPGQKIICLNRKASFNYFFEERLEAGMVLCVEAAVGEVGGAYTIKLEDQVLITEDGYENLTKYPFDPVLLGD